MEDERGRRRERVSGPVPVLVNDDVPVFRYGLSKALADAGYDVEEARDVMAWAGGPQPRCVVVVERDARAWPLVEDVVSCTEASVVVLLNRRATVESFRRALLSGASGVGAFDDPPDHLVRLVACSLRGEVVLPHEVARALALGETSERLIADEEITWLARIAQGATLDVVAKEAGYSQRELQRRLEALYQRLGVRGRMEAIAWAARAGHLDADDRS